MNRYYEDPILYLFVFQSNIRGMQYGIGTYIHELTHALIKFSKIKVFTISYKNLEIKEFTIKKKSERFCEIIIPGPLFSIEPNDNYNKTYANVVIRLISHLIPKRNVIFLFNYICDLPIILELKKTYDFPIISVVHFAQVQQILDGDRKSAIDIELRMSQEKHMYKLSNHIVCVTQYMKDFLVKEYGILSNKITVIQNGLSINSDDVFSDKIKDDLKQKLGFRKDELIIVFSGRLDPCKGILYLLDAFEEASLENPNLRLVLMGQGFVEVCQKKIQNCFGKVTFTGFLRREKVSQFYKIADIGVVPSIYDHCPYVVLEMMANNIPMIVSQINGLNELLSDSECLFVKPLSNKKGEITFSTQDWSKAILMLAANNVLRTKLSTNAYSHFSKSFTSRIMAEKMKNLLQSFNQKLPYPNDNG